MEVLAFANGVVQIGAIVVAARYVQAPRSRTLIYGLSGAALAASVAGLLAAASTGSASGAGDALTWLADIMVWLLYAAIGAAVVWGIVAALRGGSATRFAWRQGKYHRYRTYRRI